MKRILLVCALALLAPAYLKAQISGLTYTVTASTIVGTWTTVASSNSNITCGAKNGIDNGVAVNSTSHQAIVAGLKPSTVYSCTVTSGANTSSPQNVTTAALDTRVLVTSAKNGAYTLGSSSNNFSDTNRTFLSNDTKVYVTQDDGTGIVAGTPNAGFNTQVAALSNETNMTGGATLLNTYGASAAFNGTDGPAGAAMQNKSSGIFGLNGNLHMFVYRQFPPTFSTNRYGNWIKSTDHGATWNNFNAPSTFVSGGNPVTPNSPAEPVQFYASTIGIVTPVLYAADDGTLGYNTAGNQIDGGNAYVYLDYIKDADNSTLYMMRLPRIQFDAQNAASMQYWAGPPYPSTLDFTTDANWSNSSSSAVNIKPSFGTALFSPSGIWVQATFVPTINSYVMSYNLTYDGTKPLWAMFSAPTPAGPWTLFFTQPNTLSTKQFNGFFVFHRDIAGNVVSTDITSKFLQSTTPGGGSNYQINYSTLTMQPSSGKSMIQQQFYGFTTVENPLSDGGNFAALPAFNALKVTGSGVCAATVGSNGNNGAYWNGAVPSGDTGGTWPADQYSEITLQQTLASTDSLFIVVRNTSPSVRTQYLLALSGTGPTYTLYAVVTGTGNTLTTGSVGTVSAGDVFRLSITGNVLTISENGTVVTTFTDTNNFVTAAGPPGFGIQPATITNSTIASWAAGANQAALPTFSPVSGSYVGTQTVTITSASGGTIYYTTDGSTPTRSSSSISSGSTISVATSETVKAISSATNNVDSQIGGAEFTITTSVTGQVGAFLVGP